LSDREPAPSVLKRVLSRRDLILYGLVILTPTAPYPIFGIVQQTSHGHAVLSYLVAMVAMLLTAMSYGKMSGAFPSAGSTYTYASKALNPHIGFLAGWSMILDYLLIPMTSVIYAALTANRMIPAVSYSMWVVLFTTAITLINIRGMRVTAMTGNVMMVLMTFCTVIFVLLGVRLVWMRDTVRGLISTSTIYNPQTFHLHPLMLGAAIASLSYIGFDAISTLAEDTVHPEKDISYATVMVCLLETAFCVITVYVAALVWPDFASFPQTETAILDIGKVMGGAPMMTFISFILLVAGLASALTGQAGASRLLMGMGRDGVISRSFFAYVDPRYSTPVRGIYLMAAVSMIGALTLHFQIVVELLNFGAFVGFVLVNLSVIRHFYVREKMRAGKDLLTNLLCPLAGAAVCAYIWLNLSTRSQIAGFLWLGLGVLYLAFITRGFRRPPITLSPF
jgi:putrescine importer